jgi:hypothetical protein
VTVNNSIKVGPLVFLFMNVCNHGWRNKLKMNSASNWFSLRSILLLVCGFWRTHSYRRTALCIYLFKFEFSLRCCCCCLL